eukprot:15455038-Alexandrium_andersonii.AAC.1
MPLLEAPGLPFADAVSLLLQIVATGEEDWQAELAQVLLEEFRPGMVERLVEESKLLPPRRRLLAGCR